MKRRLSCLRELSLKVALRLLKDRKTSLLRPSRETDRLLNMSSQRHTSSVFHAQFLVAGSSLFSLITFFFLTRQNLVSHIFPFSPSHQWCVSNHCLVSVKAWADLVTQHLSLPHTIGCSIDNLDSILFRPLLVTLQLGLTVHGCIFIWFWPHSVTLHIIAWTLSFRHQSIRLLDD